MHDPQQLSTWGALKALLALGRIPLASEVPIWAFFGCLLSSQMFGRHSLDTDATSGIDWLATLQCVLVVWGTNISINYGNEYFDWDMDRPGMVMAIEREVKARQKIKDIKNQGASVDQVQATIRKEFGNEKIMGSSSRIIHDGTFPPYASLICASVIQALLLGMIVLSRMASGSASPFRGLALQIGILCTFLSQTYVGPPLRLHYHGMGEFVSALLLAPVAVLFGMVGHYTAITGKPVRFTDLFGTSSSGFTLDKQLWTMLLAFYCFEQARIFIMHIHDIEADRKGGKITFVVRVGYNWAKQLYVGFNIASCAFFALLAQSLATDASGLITRAGTATRTRSILAGLGALGAFALPIIVVTARSLYYHSPSNRGKAHTATSIPVLPHADLAKIVSLQTLVTPAILSATFLIAGSPR